jgi:hypothetical protein
MESTKPHGYWTKERCQEEALRYNTKSEFMKGSVGAYTSSLKKGWLEDVCAHMIEVYKPDGHWTKERCSEEAMKYKTRTEFKRSSSAYMSAQKNGWIDDICGHMTSVKKIDGYWTKERCKEEAMKYTSIEDFKRESGTAYSKTHRNGWDKEICAHLKSKIFHAGYWTKERCQEEALKYKTRSDFKRDSPSAYNRSRDQGWTDHLCAHMKVIGNRSKRLIYLATFPDDSVYIGLTMNFHKRVTDHLSPYSKSKSSVRKYSELTNTSPVFSKLSGYIDVDESRALEKYYVEHYKSIGLNVLNIVKAGGIGGDTLMWTREKCHEEALKYTSRNDLAKYSSGAYNSSLKNGWLSEICKHMNMGNQPRGFWTLKKCIEEAKKYNTRSEFKKNSAAYSAARKNIWLDQVCSHMTSVKKSDGYWTKERCHEEALKYQVRTNFSKGSTAYKAAQRNGWIDDICSHMTSIQKPNGYWTLDRCHAEALKHLTRSDFANGSGAYKIAHKNGWLDQICSHMMKGKRKVTSDKKPSGYWTKEKCQEEALKYSSRSNFKRDSTSYKAAQRNGWLDDICSHMKPN